MQGQLLTIGVLGLLVVSCASKSELSGGGLSHREIPKTNPFLNAPSDQLSASIAEDPSLKSFRVLFAGNVSGEIEPCGCAINPKGGVDRRLNFVRSLDRLDAATPTVRLDAGNALFPAEQIHPSLLARTRARAELVAEGNRLMGIDAQNVGRLDLSLGLDFLRSLQSRGSTKFVSASWIDEKGALVFEPIVRIERAGLEIFVTGLSAGFTQGPKPGFTVRPPQDALKEVVSQVPPNGVLIVLSDLGLERDREMAAQLNRSSIFIGGRDLSSLEIPEHIDKSLLVQTQLQGQQWGLLDLAYRAGRNQGWYNVGQGAHFSRLWDESVAAEELVRARPKSDESRQEELDRIYSARADLDRLAPRDIKMKSLYNQRLVNMSDEWQKPNELSAKLLKLKNR